MSAATIARLSNVTVDLGDRTILDDITLEIRQGEMLGIIGGNGSGKSTLLKLLVGALHPSTGTVTVFDTKPDSLNAQRRVGAAIDSPAMYPWMSGKANLKTILDLRGIADNGTVAAALKLFGLGETGRKPVIRFSQGMKKRLALAAASLNQPELLLLDEPTNALDPAARETITNWIEELRATGTTIIIVTHRASEAALCDRILQITPDAKLLPATVEDLRSHND